MTAEQASIIAASDKLPTQMETDLKFEVLFWVPSWLKCTWCHFSFWLHWKIICFCLGLDLWSARAAAHSRDVSVGYRQRGPGQHQPECSDESNLILRATAVACSFCLSLQALPLLHTVPQTFTEQPSLSLPLSFISICPLPIYCSSPNIPSPSRLLSLYPTTTQAQGTSPMKPLILCQSGYSLKEGQCLFWGFFLGHFEAFETEDSYDEAFEAVHNY